MVSAHVSILLSVVVSASAALAQGGQSDGNTLPLKSSRTVAFDTDEGTWMAPSVSPDGKTIVFDLVGDLYLLPIGGGKATRLTTGAAFDAQPAFSPDGKRIAFISDRNGTDNLWVMNADGTGAVMISDETNNQLINPAWTPDGETILLQRASMYISNKPEIALVAFNVADRKVITLYPKEGAQTPPGTETSSGSASPDGKLIYFSVAQRYSKQLHSVDRQSGEIKVLTESGDVGVAPIISPDGRYLVFTSQRDDDGGLRVRDLKSGKEDWLVAVTPWSPDDNWTAYYSHYVFTPDSRSVIFTADGKIKRVDIATKTVSVIPFSARVEVPAASRVDAQHRIEDGAVEIKHLGWMNASADGKRVVFSAVGKVWVSEVGGSPRRLTSSPEREFAPALSPDGQWVAYVTRSDTGGSRIVKVPFTGGPAAALTPSGGQYDALAWTSDGGRIVFTGTPKPCAFRFPSYGCYESSLRWISARGGEQSIVLPNVMASTVPRVIRTGADERIAFLDSRTQSLVSVRFDGKDTVTHAKVVVNGYWFPHTMIAPSPDMRWMLFANRNDLYVAPMPPAGSKDPIDPALPAAGARRLTSNGVSTFAWADDGKTITWTTNNFLYRVSLDDAIRASSYTQVQPNAVKFVVTLPRAVSPAKLFLTGARIITMKGDEVIPSGDILIERNRIISVTPAGRNAPPVGAKVMNLRGKTIIPGIVDVHAHLATDMFVPDAAPDFASALAFGITTARDPSAGFQTLGWAEYLEAGELVGPRLFGVGHAMQPNPFPVSSYEDAIVGVRRLKHQGATSLKQYLQPRRDQRQWIRMAAEEAGLNITNEGGYGIRSDLTLALDGFTGFEHSIRTAPLYKDVIQVFAQSGITYTPTLCCAGMGAGRFYREQKDYHPDEKTIRFLSHERSMQAGHGRNQAPMDTVYTTEVARATKDILRAGGRIGFGSHGEWYGMQAVNWEMWIYGWGGMTPLEIIRTATLTSAQSIGFGKDLGSIEPGKIADLVVLDANPLSSIKNSSTMRYVVHNGIVYDANTLDELWPVARKYPVFPWVGEEKAYQELKRRQQKSRR
jgi:Tol biopolymer transport system component